jgi:hypothetical protein
MSCYGMCMGMTQVSDTTLRRWRSTSAGASTVQGSQRCKSPCSVAMSAAADPQSELPMQARKRCCGLLLQGACLPGHDAEQRGHARQHPVFAIASGPPLDLEAAQRCSSCRCDGRLSNTQSVPQCRHLATLVNNVLVDSHIIPAPLALAVGHSALLSCVRTGCTHYHTCTD